MGTLLSASRRTWRVATNVACMALLFAGDVRAAVPSSLEKRVQALEASASIADYVWMLVAAALVLLMQAGFLLQEAGLVRSKNAISVAQKNLLDFAVSILAFASVGFMFAFGASTGYPFGLDEKFFFLSELTAWQYAFFVFQVMFCGTAATIISGAVAERMKLSAYLLCTAITAGLIYPVFAHWVWGSGLSENASAFLAAWGFIDFAGSTVVHATGAWIALAACLVIGPRAGKFDKNGNPVRLQGHNLVLASCGALLLLVGWLGFNGGSTTSANTDIAKIIANTVLAAAAGAAAAYLMGVRLDGGRVLPEKTITGLVGGLVAVTAGCFVLGPIGALTIGLVGGAVAVWANWWLEHRLKIDDPIGAIGAHGFAGIAGTLGLAFLAPFANLPADSRFDQFLIQSAGVGINFAWSFGIGLVFFLALDRLLPIRIGEKSETGGLNAAEHGTLMGVGHVENALDELVSGTADLNMRLSVAPGDEAERLTRLFNDLMDNIQAEEYSKISKADAQRAAEEAERLSAMTDSSFEAIVICVDGQIIDCNSVMETLTGIALADLKGRPLVSLFRQFDPQLRAHLCDLKVPLLETFIVNSAGEEIPIELRGREIVFRNVNTRVFAIRDLRERKMAEERIHFLAHHDPLTGTANRTVFQARLVSAVKAAQSSGSITAVYLLDLDRFKDINDLYGHPAGDEVIKVTASRLNAIVRRADTVSRLGGDEFAIIQTGLDFRTHAEDLAHRIITALSEPIDIGDGVTLRTGASVGVALCPQHGVEADDLINRADTSLYRAKKDGRNTYCVFEDGMDVAIKDRRKIEAALDRALEDEEFELWFQPQVDLKSGKVSSHEVLLRWRDPDKGLISPQDFIPVAEETGKIIRIGEWVLRKSCDMAQASGMRVSVNVSPVQFRDKLFVNTVRSILDETGLPPEQLELEVTESVIIQDDDVRSLSMLQQLKNFGLRIALDDFGTGYSSLSYLNRFPFDKIKIDKSFVQKVAESESTCTIIQTIIRLGRTLKMQIVAEGAEKAEDVQYLMREGCDAIQGFYFAKPMPMAELPLNPDCYAERLREAVESRQASTPARAKRKRVKLTKV